MTKDWELIEGDCIQNMRHLVIRGMTVDSIVCDPPYHLSTVKRFGKEGAAAPVGDGPTGVYKRSAKGFMGKEWDGGDIAFDPETWRLCYDLLPPGGHLVAFSGSRTYHRMACAIEDAGFEIRDQLMWLYGTGFPKSHDVSKGIDKAAGAERKVVGNKKAGMGSGKTFGMLQTEGDNANASHDVPITAPSTPEAQQWDGWGTALKPAHEPIVLARKPLDGTVAKNVLEYGTGAINVGACRVGDEVITQHGRSKDDFGFTSPEPSGRAWQGRWPANVMHDGSEEVTDMLGHAEKFFYSAKAGKNDRSIGEYEEVLLEWNSGTENCCARLQVDMLQKKVTGESLSEAEVLEWSTALSGNIIKDLFRTATKSTIRTITSSTIESRTWSWLTHSIINACTANANCVKEFGGKRVENVQPGLISITTIFAHPVSLPGANNVASGTQLKISVSVKPRTSKHPTIKPIALMQWLVRLVTPPGGMVLDPFAGSGTTGEAALAEGMRCTLMERDPEYAKDIMKRLTH